MIWGLMIHPVLFFSPPVCYPSPLYTSHSVLPPSCLVSSLISSNSRQMTSCWLNFMQPLHVCKLCRSATSQLIFSIFFIYYFTRSGIILIISFKNQHVFTCIYKQFIIILSSITIRTECVIYNTFQHLHILQLKNKYLHTSWCLFSLFCCHIFVINGVLAFSVQSLKSGVGWFHLSWLFCSNIPGSYTFHTDAEGGLYSGHSHQVHLASPGGAANNGSKKHLITGGTTNNDIENSS